METQRLTIPDEAFQDNDFYVKRQMKTRQPFLFELINNVFDYIFSIEDFNRFERYNYISGTSPGEMTAEIYETVTLKYIEESPKPAQ